MLIQLTTFLRARALARIATLKRLKIPWQIYLQLSINLITSWRNYEIIGLDTHD
jgi:hypothetical protein